MKLALDVIRGMVIGFANIIPGVSGGTMMVSMGIYDSLIYAINHLFRDFKRSVLTLLPYLIGMGAAIIIGAFGLKAAFEHFPLPTNFLFIGLILGSVPMIVKQMKGEKKGVPGILCFLLLFALVVILKVIEAENSTAITLSLGTIVKLLLLGAVASATMVIPGVSGSMLLKTLGYYEPIVTVAIPDFISALMRGDWSALWHNIGILLPFGIGIVVGIFAIAQLISVLMKRWKGVTYCAILGMVAASPVVILMNKALYADLGIGVIVASALTLLLGAVLAYLLGGERDA